MSKNRDAIVEILKGWAQGHNRNYVIADPDSGDDAIDNTGMYLAWCVRQDENATINLLDLANQLEKYADKLSKNRNPDGMFCINCGQFYQYAEPNQPDGSLICYACRINPY